MTNHSAPRARAALTAALCLSVVGSPGVAAAQNVGLTPLYGSRALSFGFTPDPHEAPVRAGGPVNAEGRGLPGSCVGNITEAPTFQLRRPTGGALPLIFRTASTADTSLLVSGPDGTWHCDDDSGSGLAAEVVFERATAGVYNVWVGHLQAGTASATLSISELRSSSDEDEWDEMWEDEDAEPAPTNISIKLCNDNARPARFAVSYKPEGDAQFATRGWFAIAGGACSIVATTTNAVFYVYGETTDGALQWSGDWGTCVRYPGPFFEYLPPGDTCASGQSHRLFVRQHAEDFGEVTVRVH